VPFLMKSNPKIARFSWALYDLANTIFSMNIISLFFAVWLTVDKGCKEAYYSFALGSSIFLAASFMPIIGEITDRLRKRIPFLIAFTLGCVTFTAMLGLIKTVSSALLFFALANFCYHLGAMVYNSLLSQVSTVQTLGRTSGLGVSLGYLGTILGLILVKPFLDIGGRQATFIPTAMLFLLFATPSFVFIKDLPHPHLPRVELNIKPIFLRLLKGLSQIRQNPSLLRFFISAFLCLNAVSTIIVYMGVYANRVMNFADAQLVYFMIFSTLFAIAGSYAFGHLTDLWGSRDTLNLIIKLWCLAIFLAGIATSNWMFWLIGPLIGICLGGTWVSARTMLVEMVSQEKVGRMFGLFGLVNMLSFILGTIVWGIITSWVFVNLGVLKYRLAIGSVFIFMFSGYLVFQGVSDPRKVDA
jgi:UMF1 family MFS transporter